MSGEVFRLKNWTDYRQKLAKGEPGMISEGFKTRPGMHTVVVTLGAIGETEPLTEEWVKAHMRGLGWVPEDEGPNEAGLQLAERAVSAAVAALKPEMKKDL